MNVAQAILEELKPYPIREALVNKKCVDEGLQPDKAYNKEHREATLRVVRSVLAQYLTLGSITEGGVSISIADTQKRIRLIDEELGIESSGLYPTVKYLDI